MGLILCVFVLPICVVVVLKRRRRHANVAVPLLLAVYVLASAAWTMRSVIRSLAGAANVEPATKASLLAIGFSEFLNSAALGLIIHIPLLFAAYLLDRKLLAPAVDSAASLR